MEGPDSEASPFPEARFIAGPVPRLRSMSRLEFLENHAGRNPFVLEAGAAGTAPVRRWDPEYMTMRSGDARLELLAGVYERGARSRGYPDARQLKATLREVIASLQAGDPGTGYLFNVPSSVLRTNGSQPEFHVGWGDRPNPGLTALDEEFELPGFAREEDLIHAFLLIGGKHHAGPLHYDLGGEAKVLVQIRGRKRVLLFPPRDVPYLHFPGWLEPPSPFRSPHVSDVDLQAPDLERFPDLEKARGYEALLEPGDVLYWPPFWPHDVTNLDDFTVAVSVAFEELRANPMLFRESLGILVGLYTKSLGTPPGPEMEAALRRVEALIVSDPYRELTTYYGWQGRAWSGEQDAARPLPR